MDDGVGFGLDTFGDVTVDAEGHLLHPAQVIRDVVEEAVLADELGVDAFGVGEHHRDDYAVSAPDVVLAAVAARTSRVTLGTAVTVLSSDDPVRVYERFSTLDAISSGRTEITVGRGSFVESFPLFGYDLKDYDRLFTEKLDLFARIRREEPVTWKGTTRAPLTDARVRPTTQRGGIPTWVGVGGTPESVVRAARYGFNLALAVIGGAPARFRPFVDLYRRALDEYGQPRLPVLVHSPGFVADTDDEAREQLYPYFTANRDRIGRERGWGPTTRADYDREVAEGAVFAGSPETVAQKIAATVRALGVDRFDLKYSNGPMPHAQLLRCIELYATQVVPRVRELLA
jgi:probable LLM family oxidoreductase